MEHKRAELNGKLYQWIDTEYYIVMDTVTGRLERASKDNNTVCTLSEALDYRGMVRHIIIKLNAIKPMEII